MHVLFVKLTSLGDVIHALPALTDAQAAVPGIRFDWVVDEALAPVAGWHPAVDTIIPTAHRRWRRQMWRTLRSGELPALAERLRAKRYDYIIDGQNRIKSALVARLARGPRGGLDARSSHEYGVHFLYEKRATVGRPHEENAVERVRSLFAQLLGYSLPDTPPDFRIDIGRFVAPPVALPERYLLFLANAGWPNKLWPENYWSELLRLAAAAGHVVLLAAGSAAEEQRAVRLAGSRSDAIVLPRMPIEQIAHVVSRARATVCLDTGLGHLAAALRVPSVHLYGPTSGVLTGPPFGEQFYLQADFPCSPCYRRVCTYTKPSSEKPACYTTLPPALVWRTLQNALGAGGGPIPLLATADHQ
jgi:heptosyltransferase-1